MGKGGWGERRTRGWAQGGRPRRRGRTLVKTGVTVPEWVALKDSSWACDFSCAMGWFSADILVDG